jgi:hypothetical protein
MYLESWFFTLKRISSAASGVANLPRGDTRHQAGSQNQETGVLLRSFILGHADP